ncbi:methyltransferase domain-containing protein [candidate division KSB1 bacterium]|nr:methyltransferase domain-containing protein [candidate division KSB1 bacterium]
MPRYCRRDLSDFPHRRRFLVADKVRIAEWKARLATLGDGLKVGISWQGGNKPAIRKSRSTTLDQWMPLLKMPGIDFVNLQYGDCTQELEELRNESDVTISHWEESDPLQDLDGFAAQISALDLVISIDNSTVHMAGALGVPVWTLLPVSPNWRWMLERDDSPWYPSMRLFRQTEPMEWESVFARVADELRGFRKPADTTTVSLTKPADDEADTERQKYEQIWSHDSYREKSPGLDNADKISLIPELRKRGCRSVLDAGCGSGKLMQRLMTEHADEFDVHGFDISGNCLDPYFDGMKNEVLTVGCLWNRDDLPGEYDAVICTDVMEHIPTDRVPAVLENLRRCTRKFAYFAIALFPDGFGPLLIGEPLHLTVERPGWWFAKLGIAGFRIEGQTVEQHENGQDMWLHVFAEVATEND